MTMDEAIMMVLKMIEEGKVSAEDGAKIIEKLQERQGDGEKKHNRKNTEKSFSDTTINWDDIGPDIEDHVHRHVRDNLHKVLLKVKGIGGGKKEKIFSHLDLSGTVGGILDTVFSAVDRKLDDLYEEYAFRQKVHFSEEIESSDARDLEIHNFAGDIICRKGEGELIHIEGTKYGGGNTEEEALKKAEDTGIDIMRRGDTIHISSSHPNNRKTRVDYFVTLPAGIALQAHNVKGDVTVEQIDSNLELKVVNGELKISKNKGEIEAKVVHGDIHLKELEGKIHIRGVNADLEAENLTGEISLKMVNGDAQIEHSSGTMEIETMSGDSRLLSHRGAVSCKSASGEIECMQLDSADIDCRTKSGDIDIEMISFIDGSINLKSMSGDIDLNIPSSSSALIRGKTLSGDIAVDAEDAIVERDTSNRAEIRFGEGKGRGDIATTSGDIRIRGSAGRA
jgi:DUF4097 and DUF4098 domain-containing protein YvlB